MSFFPPPRRLETEVLTRLPDRFRRPRRTAWADFNRGGREIDSFLEGPSFDRDGRLYVTDVAHGRIFRIDPRGEWEQVAEYDGWPNGLKIHRDGRVLVTDYRRGLLELNPEMGRITPLLETVRSEGFKGLNDLFIAGNGDIFFTDQGQTGLHDPTGRLYRLETSGRLTCLIDTVPSPNGLVVLPDLSAVLLAVTRANQIWRIPLQADGGVTKASVFCHLHGGPGGPDGMALDAAGNLLVAHAGFGTVWRLSPLAEPLDRIASCAGAFTTNLAFGGPANDLLHIVESDTGSILLAQMEVPGLALDSHAPAS